jgi:hypothetical protein
MSAPHKQKKQTEGIMKAKNTGGQPHGAHHKKQNKTKQNRGS